MPHSLCVTYILERCVPRLQPEAGAPGRVPEGEQGLCPCRGAAEPFETQVPWGSAGPSSFFFFFFFLLRFPCDSAVASVMCSLLQRGKRVATVPSRSQVAASGKPSAAVRSRTWLCPSAPSWKQRTPRPGCPGRKGPDKPLWQQRTSECSEERRTGLKTPAPERESRTSYVNEKNLLKNIENN